MNLLSKTLACSGLLAARQQTVVPDLPLAWNPRDDKSTIRAVGAFLSHVSAHVFPVANCVVDLDTSIEYLTHIPLMGQGFNYWYEVTFDEMFPGLHRLLCIFLTLENNLEMDQEAAYIAYIALRDEGIDEMVPLFKVYGWLEACISGKRPFPHNLLPEGSEHWQGLANHMRYLSNDTGIELLDFSDDEEEDMFLEMELDWLDADLVERYRTGWVKAQSFRETINQFVSWTNTWENYLRTKEVIAMICHEVKQEWGVWGEKSAWGMSAMREAYEEMTQHMAQQYDGWEDDEEE
jgi:hypothetical protein